MFKIILGIIFTLFFGVVFMASIREKNWVAALIWGIPFFFFLGCIAIALFIQIF